MLQLEISIAAHLPHIESETIMLTHITITADTRGILQKQSLLIVFLGNDIHHTGNSIAAIKGRRSTFHNFYFLNIVRVNQTQVILSAHISMNTLSVDENQNIVVAQTIHLHL